MSYLEITGLDKVGKAVISFWFRVPQASVDKALAAAKPKQQQGDVFVGPPLNGVIPLVTLGKPGKTSVFQTATNDHVLSYEYHAWTWYYSNPLSDAVALDQWRAPWITDDGTPWEGQLVPGGIPVLHVVWDFRNYPNGVTGSWSMPESGFYDNQGNLIITQHNPGYSYTQHTEALDPADTDPTVIGVQCAFIGGEAIYQVDPPGLYVNLETGTKANIQAVVSQVTSIQPHIQWDAPSTETSSHNIFEMVYPLGIGTTLDDAQSAMQQPPTDLATYRAENPNTVYHSDPPGSANQHLINYLTDYTEAEFGNDTAAFYNDPSSCPAPADHWHHVLISFDIKPCVARGEPDRNADWPGTAAYIDSTTRLWVALDDVNYTQSDLSPNWPDGSDDPNAVITDDAYQVAGRYYERLETHEGYWAGPPDNRTYYLPYDVFSTTLPSYNANCTKISADPMGLPAAAIFVNNIYGIELAEFQMFTGVTLETANEPSRRAFIDYPRDKDGKPTKDYLAPVDPKKAEALLGKKPDILLHGSGNWIRGNNTGALGVDQDGKPIPAGQFTPKGKIISYKPNPSLDPANQGTRTGPRIYPNRLAASKAAE